MGRKTRQRIIKVRTPDVEDGVTISFDESVLALAFAVLWPEDVERAHEHRVAKMKIEDFLNRPHRRKRYMELVSSGELGRSRAVSEMIISAIAAKIGRDTLGRYSRAFHLISGYTRELLYRSDS